MPKFTVVGTNLELNLPKDLVKTLLDEQQEKYDAALEAYSRTLLLNPHGREADRTRAVLEASAKALYALSDGKRDKSPY